MAISTHKYDVVLLFFSFLSVLAVPGDESKPLFAFSWLDDKDTFIAGDTATIKVKILGQFDPKSYKQGFNLTVSVNGKDGNSTYVSGLSLNFGGDPANSWTVTFVPILAGVHNILITDDYFGVLDSSLHFFVHPGPIHPAASIAFWMDYVEEYEAGTRAMVLVLPNDAFGNNIPSTNADLNSFIFNVSASYTNGSAANVLSVTFLGWNDVGYLRIEFIAASAGDLLLHVQKENQTLRGSPLPFKVNPGPVEVSKCVAKWNYDTNASQLFSKMEIFIHQLDLYGNLVPGFYPFDAEIIEKGTNLSIPVADLLFTEASPGIQLLSFSALEPGNFLLVIFDEKHNRSISDMPYEFTVFIGYCDGMNSVINGSGLNHSISGQQAKFSVYLKDRYQYPSAVELDNVQVQIVQETDSYSVLPLIVPLETTNGSRSPWQMSDNAVAPVGVPPVASVDGNNTFAGTSKVVAHAYDVIYTPEKTGVYDIRILCGNILLNDGKPFKKEVTAGEVNTSLSGVVKYDSKVPKLAKNEILVHLMDSFGNAVLSQEAKLKLEIANVNHSGFLTWMFVDNNNGSYMGQYVAKDVGTYEICASFNGSRFLPCPFGVNVYSGEYFPKAYNDSISVWEDGSIAFDALGNDYFAGGNATIVGFSFPHHGTLLQKEHFFRYTPYKGFYGNDSFSYTISDVNGNIAAASVNISVLIIPPQFVSFPIQLQAIEDVISPKYGGFCSVEITYPDLTKSISVTVSAKSGTVFLSPMLMQFWREIWDSFSVGERDGEAKGLTLSGHVEVINIALQSIQYIGDENFYGEDTIKISTMNRNGVNDLDITVYVEPVNDPPFIHAPEHIILEENDNANGALIYDRKRDKFEFLIGDPDVSKFPGNASRFLVMLSLEVSSGALEAILPAELVNATELKLKSSYQWQPLQTFVTISKHFTVKAKGLRFRASIDDCNNVIQQLKYHDTELGALLLIAVNDLGNYGCDLDCRENSSKSLFAEANINLIKRRPMSSMVSHALGSVIIIEFLMVVSLGALLLFFICKCATSLLSERTNHNTTKNAVPGAQTFVNQTPSAAKESHKVSCSGSKGCCHPFVFRGEPSNFRQRSRRKLDTH